MNNSGVISNGLSATPFLIGVAGGTASGKVSNYSVICINASVYNYIVISGSLGLFYGCAYPGVNFVNDRVTQKAI